MIVPPGRPSSAFRSSLDRFHDASSYRKGRCRREENDYRDLGPGKYDRSSFMELQQTRPKTMGSIPGGSSFHRSTVTRRGSNGDEGRKDRPHVGPGTYHRASRMFFAKNEAIMFLPGSRRGFHSFLGSGRSKTLMDDAVLFKTARPAGQQLGPGSYDLPSTLTNGIRPNTAPVASVAHHSDRPLPQSSRSDGTSMLVACHQRRTADASKAPHSESWTGGQQAGGQQQQHFYFREERAADVEAVRALPALR